MKKYLKWIAIMLLMLIGANRVNVIAEEHDHEHEESGAFSADHHHAHGTTYASFIPEKILNPDDSQYQAPEATEDYVGVYTAQTPIEELGVKLNMILNIQEDGLFNLAYYYENDSENKGIRFYANEANEIQESEAVYQDLNLLTGGLREGEGGLGSGLIGETLSPVVLLDNQGKPEELYAYRSMAYGLREQYVNARVYQNVGLYIAEDVVGVDVNHLIGLDSENQITAQFELVKENHEDQFLVETPTFELLQHNFDTHLVDHNDFDMSYESVNEFVQKVLAMHLETNASFPEDTEVELVNPENVEQASELVEWDLVYAMVINDAILYVHDGTKLYMTTEFEVTDGQYSASEWVTN